MYVWTYISRHHQRGAQAESPGPSGVGLLILDHGTVGMIHRPAAYDGEALGPARLEAFLEKRGRPQEAIEAATGGAHVAVAEVGRSRKHRDDKLVAEGRERLHRWSCGARAARVRDSETQGSATATCPHFAFSLSVIPRRLAAEFRLAILQ